MLPMGCGSILDFLLVKFAKGVPLICRYHQLYEGSAAGKGTRFQEVLTLLYHLPLVLIHGLGQVQEQRQEVPLYRDVKAYYKLEKWVLSRTADLDKVLQPDQKEL